MKTYPMDADARMAERERIEAEAIGRARREAARLARSPKCAGWLAPLAHADDPDGCANDGTTCLCSCHDYGGGPL